MFCWKCGEKNDDNALFCKQCGTPIKAAMNEPQGTHHKTVQAIHTNHKSTVVSPTESHKHTKHDDRNLLENFIDAFKKYAVFKGRSSRREYWMFYLAVIMIQIILLVMYISGSRVSCDMTYIVSNLGEYIQNVPYFFSFDPMSVVAMMLVPIALLIPSAAAIVSRLSYISKRTRIITYSILAAVHVVALFMMTANRWYVFSPVELFESLALLSILIPTIALAIKKLSVRIGLYAALLIIYLLGLTYIMIAIAIIILISGALLILATIIPSVAIAVRRLHDTDRSAWWLLMNIVPIVGPIVYIVILAMDGNYGDNQYGLDPRVG